MSIRAYLSLGSNLGDREKNLKLALVLLDAHPEVEVVNRSGFYESEPLYFIDQGRFLNCVIELSTDLPPANLLLLCQRIEKTLGRRKSVRYGPRIIDLDILSYGERVIISPDLKIPHPRMQERRFVLLPLCQLNPEWVHPVVHKSAKQLLEELGGEQKVRSYRFLHPAIQPEENKNAVGRK